MRCFTWQAPCCSSCMWTKVTRDIAICDAGVLEQNLWNLLQPKPNQLVAFGAEWQRMCLLLNSKKTPKIQPTRMCARSFSTFQTSSDHPAVPSAEPSLISRCKLCWVWREVLASSFLWNAAGSDLSKPGRCRGTVEKLFTWSVNSGHPNNMPWCWNHSEQQTRCR